MKIALLYFICGLIGQLLLLLFDSSERAAFKEFTNRDKFIIITLNIALGYFTLLFALFTALSKISFKKDNKPKSVNVEKLSQTKKSTLL